MDEKMKAINDFVKAEIKLYEVLNNEFTNILMHDFETNQSEKAANICKENLDIRVALASSIMALNKYLETLASNTTPIVKGGESYDDAEES